MEVFVGTSGWMYSWNPDGFEWYVQNSNLNAIELNMSFYRYPFRNQVKGWARKSKDIRWSVKVNKVITHYFKLDSRALERWGRFKEIFEPLEKFIDFYLFQLPPSFGIRLRDRVERFVEKTDLGERFAIEFRNSSWFKTDLERFGEELGITIVSVDAPNLPREVFCCNGMIYLRMHGRSCWYGHWYSEEELREVCERILKKRPKKVYVFFNNNHAMLENARRMREILKDYHS